MTTTVFPETSDSVTEAAWQSLNDAMAAGGSHLSSGFDVSDGGGVVVDVAAGEAFVNGYHISSDAVQNQTLTDAATNYLWLNPDGTLTDNTTGTNPGNAIRLAVVVCAGGSISSITADRDVLTGGRLLVTKAAAENVSSSTTLQDDDALVIALEPGVYTFTFCLNVTWGATGGIKVSLTSTSTNESIRASVFHGTDTASTNGFGFITASGGTYSFAGTAATTRGMIIDGSVSLADAGTFKLQWAQSVSNGTNTTVGAESMVFLQRIA